MITKIKVRKNPAQKAKGIYVYFKIKDHDERLKIYTSRPDILFGVTFLVISTNHSLIDKYQYKIKGKSSARLNGLTAINPVNGEELPIYVADYIGTKKSIMAVPAHNKKDYAFAKKFNLPIRQVIAPNYFETGKDAIREGAPITKREIMTTILKYKDKYVILDWSKQGWYSFIGGGIEEGETIEDATIKEVQEEGGYKNIVIDHVSNFHFYDHFYASHKGLNREVANYIVYAHLANEEKSDITEEELENHVPLLIDEAEVLKIVNKPNKECLEWIFPEEKPWLKEGIMINSSFLNGINSGSEAISKMVDYLNQKEDISKKIF